MGRKIPAKKHRGVKDPLVQQERRLQSLKSKINAPPKDPDEQPVPRSLTRLFEFNNTTKNNKTPKKNQQLKCVNNSNIGNVKGSHNARGIKRNPIAQLRKLPGETGRDFSLRINSAIKALHNPTEPLDYPHEVIEEEDEKGARMAAQRERRARKHRRALQHAPPAEPTPSRAQRRAARNKDKKLKALQARQARQERREVQYERVEFGEVCDAPPALRLGRTPRPGRRDLLLTKMLSGGGGGEGGGTGGAAAAGAALRRERARLDAVAAYRALKAQRHASVHSAPG